MARASTNRSLGQRIATIRRSHFGARGKAAFAERIGVPTEALARYERGHIPPGDLLVRMCECTGEDLQWLLTGASSRESVVISGARARHGRLLTRLAHTLDQSPRLATAIEAFLDLLTAKPSEPPRQLEGGLTTSRRLLPLYTARDAPRMLPSAPVALEAANELEAGLSDVASPADVFALHDLGAHGRLALTSEVAAYRRQDRAGREGIDHVGLAAAFPDMFGVELADGDMQPLFDVGDVALATLAVLPRIGAPVLACDAENGVRCRIWLGEQDEHVSFGRVGDHGVEQTPRSAICWAREVLFRLRPAA